MRESNLDILNSLGLIKGYELIFLLDFVLDVEEKLIDVIENLFEERALNPSDGYVKNGTVYALTNKKIAIISLKENSETVETIPINQVVETSIERAFLTNDRQYKSIKKIRNLKIIFKNRHLVDFEFDETKTNNLNDFQKFQEDATRFITNLNKII